MSCSQDGQSETIAFQQLTRHGRSHNIYLPAPESPALIQFIHVSIRGEWKRGLQKKTLFHYSNMDHLSVEFAPSHAIDSRSFPQTGRAEFRSRLAKVNTTTHLLKRERGQSRFFKTSKEPMRMTAWTKRVKNWLLILAASQLWIWNTPRVSCRFAPLQWVQAL